MSVLNISTYKFVTLDDRESLRPRIQQQCGALGLKGTILLSPRKAGLAACRSEKCACG
jgi:UPF0176 protein